MRFGDLDLTQKCIESYTSYAQATFKTRTLSFCSCVVSPITHSRDDLVTLQDPLPHNCMYVSYEHAL